MTRDKKAGQVPYSAGTNGPDILVPDYACDCHLHIYDPDRFPYPDQDGTGFPQARVEEYRLLQDRLNLKRCVIVTPSAYGTENACTLDALSQLGDHARGVVVIDSGISDEELKQMDRRGVCGIRFNLVQGRTGDTREVRDLAERIAPLGWHICFWMNADTIAALEDFLSQLPCPIVFDHRGHLPASLGIRHKAFSIITELMRAEKAYVKLSALYHDSESMDYSDTKEVGKAYVEAAPDRVLWGTDWPHPSEYYGGKGMPDDARMLDALLDQAGDYETVHRILVENPARLYHF